MRVLTTLVAVFLVHGSVVCRAADQAGPLRVGIIGADTSHCEAFTSVLNDPNAPAELAGVKVVAVYPSGSFDIPNSRDRVAPITEALRKKGVEVVDSIDALLGKVDCVLLESVDGRRHLAEARPVIAAKKPLFIDKPMAASLADAMEIFRLAKESNVPCFSASSLRFVEGLDAIRNGQSDLGKVKSCTAWSPMELEPHHPDMFWYGVHGAETLFTIMGPGCKTVTRVAPDKAAGVWKDGRQGTFVAKQEMGATIEGEKATGNAAKYSGYAPLLVEIVKFFKTGKPPVAAEETLEILAFMEAADESKRLGGAPVEIDAMLKRAADDLGRRHQSLQAMPQPKLVAEDFDSGFEHSHDTYNGMGTGSDGKIYYVLSATPHDVAGRMYAFDPATKQIKLCGDLTEACSEKDMKAVAQGKSHCNFVEASGKLYFSTHTGFYAIIDDMEKMGPPPEGWKDYQGGHFLAYDMATGAFEDLGIPYRGEGILTMNMDARRGRLYGLTWPSAHFVTCDLATKQLKDLGPTARDGENGKGDRYRTICRSLAINPDDGSVYYTNGDGDIFRYDYARQTIEPFPGENLRKDYFGLYDPTSPGHMGYNWRQVVWYDAEKAFYGVHGNSGYLFRFDPSGPYVDLGARLTSNPSKLSGMFDQFSYGYLGFTLGPDGRTLYYLTGGPIYENGKRVTGKDTTGKGEAKGLENLHLVTYDIPTGACVDHGEIFLRDGQRPLYVNSIALDRNGAVYTLGRIDRGGKIRTDLIRVSLDPAGK